MKCNTRRVRLTWATVLVWITALVSSNPVAGAKNISDWTILVKLGLMVNSEGEPAGKASSSTDENPNQVLEWNQIFVETLIGTNTANSSSQRLGAIVHTAIFDAYNGIEQRYTPLFVRDRAPRGASRRAAVISAGYTALVGIFPSEKTALDTRYEASLAALRL